MRSLFSPVLELVYPTFCGGGCGRQGDALCRVCAASFVALDPDHVCPICGRYVGRPAVCGRCMGYRRTPFDRGFYGYSFEGALREAMHAFKFQGRKDVGRAMVRTLAKRIEQFANAFDLLVPLPVTEKRLRARGFNQSFIICEEISQITGKSIAYETLFKTRETPDQFTLSREERKRNVKGAFSAFRGDDRLEDARVLLVDDLYTTGSTAQEAGKALFTLKPREILFFALARTPE